MAGLPRGEREQITGTFEHGHFLLRLTAIRTVIVLYKPKDQQGCQRRYTTRETLVTMARKCQTTRRMRMRSKDNLSCARLQAGRSSNDVMCSKDDVLRSRVPDTSLTF
jgi:hypothetical protein